MEIVIGDAIGNVARQTQETMSRKYGANTAATAFFVCFLSRAIGAQSSGVFMVNAARFAVFRFPVIIRRVVFPMFASVFASSF